MIYINKNGEVEVDFKGRLCLAGTGILNFVLTLQKVLLLLATNTFFGTQTKSRCPSLHVSYYVRPSSATYFLYSHSQSRLIQVEYVTSQQLSEFITDSKYNKHLTDKNKYTCTCIWLRRKPLNRNKYLSFLGGKTVHQGCHLGIQIW